MTKEIDFSRYLSLKIGPKLPVHVIQSMQDYDRNWRILGFGCNLLVSPEAKNLAILGKEFDYIKDLGEQIEIGASTSSAKIFRYFKDNDLLGLEFLRSLPGSLGGLVKMNAGMKGYEIKLLLDSVNIDGEWKEASELGIEYRSTKISGVIFAARFLKKRGFRSELLCAFAGMRKSHPRLPSCGSCFKNPAGDFAGRLLELAGLKGYFINGVGFSRQHANFLVNESRGSATFCAAKKVIEEAQQRVEKVFGIKLQREVIILE
ncbi:UDP-N-acetylmuramate dehydrogenase [Helicobacter mustelae]|uniref:UDP-N-acetylenolpyruvoylglucosamine reductase n=1 Tax=Helicobacter mustelae (strain ATCC 43772 / CCUG 25715 / CIP 103759 / LMG 18044 / NCTC 12198 / R85-136P) TaxID=679897 RepID=D3UH68_HELM1|nr:UDP-N-acetylmuramate dehydrogenase [Helicobacter mustelae]CBG39840.1 putative UDP-N-acetylenolpyruvoylglucosamine reductase [Helicobacter mustelae 12198]SQH71349.1 UDP-N-acetylenolpyruvoylglucosamine reductase [Helicobacter mustelae]STP12476.1 UDP-N-acetylenolpyruvoylglucosamine reductase [Helicobacter mustelae]